MERTGNPIDDESHLDAGNVTKVIPTLLSPSFAVESKPSSYSDEDENEGGTYDGNNTGYLEILSSEDEEPKGNSLVDEIVVPHWIQLDPKYSKREGAPKKLRRKGHFESSSKKSKNSTTDPKKSSTSRRSNEISSSSAHFQEVQTPTAVPDLPRHPVGIQESIVDMN